MTGDPEQVGSLGEHASGRIPISAADDSGHEELDAETFASWGGGFVEMYVCHRCPK